MDLVGGRGLPRRLHFVKFACQSKRIGTHRGRVPGAPPGSAMMYMVNSSFTGGSEITTRPFGQQIQNNGKL